MSAIPVVRIRPCEQHQCPGHDFVEINESDFDPKKGHVLYAPDGDVSTPIQAGVSDDEGKAMTVAEIRDALTAKRIPFDPATGKKALRELLEASE